jgi:hypothetical protein
MYDWRGFPCGLVLMRINRFRASMYMRPTAIWAMEYALEKK